MLGFMSDWVSGVAAATVLTALALAVTPQGTVRKIVALCAGLLMTAALVRPLIGFSGGAEIDGLVLEAEGENIADRVNEALSDIIEGQTAAYIVNKAQALGINCSVTVKCRTGEHYPQPWSVTVRSRTPEHAMSAMADMIEADMGIPRERQKYTSSSV